MVGKKSLIRRGFLLSLVFLLSSCTSTYVGRLVIWNFGDYESYSKFPHRDIINHGIPYAFVPEASPLSLSDNLVQADLARFGNIESLLKENDTTAFIVLKNNQLAYEKYFNSKQRDSKQPGYSVTKSIISLLIGIAIDEGKINSLHDPIASYLPELKSNPENPITIEHLLTMTSGFEYYPSFGFLPWSTDVRVAYSPDIQNLALELKAVEQPGQTFLYHNQVPVLLSIILQRATGKTVSQYTQEKLWQPLGMEYPAFWLLDSEQSGFEKADGGFVARAVDYAKLGQLVLNEGVWQGRQIISKQWIASSTTPDLSQYHLNNLFERQGFYYKYLWWGQMTDKGYAAIADGRFGQFIFVYPELDVVIVRNGRSMGSLSHLQWYELMIKVAEHAQGNQ